MQADATPINKLHKQVYFVCWAYYIEWKEANQPVTKIYS